MQETLDGSEDRRYVIRRGPPVLQYIETQFAVIIHVRVEHSRQEFYSRWFVGVRLVKRKQELEGSILERRVRWTKDYRIPYHNIIRTWAPRNATWWIARKTFEVTDKASPTVRRHRSVSVAELVDYIVEKLRNEVIVQDQVATRNATKFRKQRLCLVNAIWYRSLHQSKNKVYNVGKLHEALV